MRPFFKITTTFPENPKLLAAPLGARWLYLCAVAYCARHTTDGFFLITHLPKLSDVRSPKVQASKLLELGLWHAEGHTCPKCPPCPAGQYLIHDYLEHQQSAVNVASVRAQRAVSGASGGLAKARNRQNTQKSLANRQGFASAAVVPEKEVEEEEELKPKVKTNTAARKRTARKKPDAQESIPLPVPVAEADPLETKAQEILKWWWELQEPRPAGKNAWHAGLAVILGLLRAGHEPKAVAAAAREIGSPLTIPRMEITLNRSKVVKPSTTRQRVDKGLELVEYYRQRGE